MELVMAPSMRRAMCSVINFSRPRRYGLWILQILTTSRRDLDFPNTDSIETRFSRMPQIWRMKNFSKHTVHIISSYTHLKSLSNASPRPTRTASPHPHQNPHLYPPRPPHPPIHPPSAPKIIPKKSSPLPPLGPSRVHYSCVVFARRKSGVQIY